MFRAETERDDNVTSYVWVALENITFYSTSNIHEAQHKLKNIL